jgi:hypothetical protein
MCALVSFVVCSVQAADFDPTVMMDVEKRSHATAPNLLQWYYPATTPDIQRYYARRSPNRQIDVQQVMWGTLMKWSHNRYYIPGYLFLGSTSWALLAATALAAGGYEAASEYGNTACTARKLGADYAVYSSEWKDDPVIGRILQMQAAYYVKR